MGLYRLFLAIVVAYDHWRESILRPAGQDNLSGLFSFDAGHAVIFFYVISGFLITYTLTNNYSDDSGGRLKFYRNRFIRIFSVYWPLAAFSIYEFVGYNGLVSTPLKNIFTQLFLFGQDWSVAFGRYPDALDFSGSLPALYQAWTLGAELGFYLIAPFLMRTWKLGAAVLVISLLVRFSFLAVLGDVQSFPRWTYLFFPSTVCFFMLGHLICLASTRFPILLHLNLALLAPTTIVALPATLVIVFLAKISGFVFDGPALWVPLTIAVATMPALFEATKDNRIMNYLGNLSYPLYLIHTGVLLYSSAAIVRYVLPFGPALTEVVFLALALVASVAVHHCIEKPVAGAMRLAFSFWKTRAVAVEPSR